MLPFIKEVRCRRERTLSRAEILLTRRRRKWFFRYKRPKPAVGGKELRSGRKFCGQGGGGSGFSNANVQTFCKKTLKFFKNYGASARSKCGHFANKSGGKGVQFFRDFVTTYFMNRPYNTTNLESPKIRDTSSSC